MELIKSYSLILVKFVTLPSATVPVCIPVNKVLGFLWWLNGKESACSAEDPGSVHGSERSSGEGNGNPLQCSCLENSMDRGDWRATVPGVGYDLVTQQQDAQGRFLPSSWHNEFSDFQTVANLMRQRGSTVCSWALPSPS